jgi:agmatinase
LDIVDSYYSGKIRYNSGTVFRRATEENLLDPSSSTQIGSNGSIFPEMQPSFSRQLGYQVINVEEALRMGPEALSSLIVDRVRNKKVYLSFDVDVMDVCVAPGSGAPEVGGFLTREVLQIVRQLNEVQFIGFDVVEVNPLFDCSNITSIFAANLAFEFMTLIALGRRKRPPIGKRY